MNLNTPNILENYEIANKKLKKLENSSDINTETENEFGRSKRQKRTPQRYDSDITDSEIEEDVDLPLPPPIAASCMKASHELSQDVSK